MSVASYNPFDEFESLVPAFKITCDMATSPMSRPATPVVAPVVVAPVAPAAPDDCPVCYDPMITTVKSACGHAVCVPCFLAIAASTGRLDISSKCPMCRAALIPRVVPPPPVPARIIAPPGWDDDAPVVAPAVAAPTICRCCRTAGLGGINYRYGFWPSVTHPSICTRVIKGRDCCFGCFQIFSRINMRGAANPDVQRYRA